MTIKIQTQNRTPNLEAENRKVHGTTAKNQPDKLLPIVEAAELLGLRPSTIRSCILHRRISVVRIGRRAIRVQLSVIHQLIEAGTIPAKDSGHGR